MKFLLPLLFFLFSSAVLSQSFDHFQRDKSAQESVLFKKKFTFKPGQTQTSLDQFSVLKMELKAQKIMINSEERLATSYLDNMPCLKTEYPGNMTCIIPDENSLMPIINPTDSKFALIGNVK